MTSAHKVSVLEALAEYTSIPVDNTYRTLSIACALVGLANVASAVALHRCNTLFCIVCVCVLCLKLSR